MVRTSRKRRVVKKKTFRRRQRGGSNIYSGKFEIGDYIISPKGDKGVVILPDFSGRPEIQSYIDGMIYTAVLEGGRIKEKYYLANNLYVDRNPDTETFKQIIKTCTDRLRYGYDAKNPNKIGNFIFYGGTFMKNRVGKILAYGYTPFSNGDNLLIGGINNNKYEIVNVLSTSAVIWESTKYIPPKFLEKSVAELLRIPQGTVIDIAEAKRKDVGTFNIGDCVKLSKSGSEICMDKLLSTEEDCRKVGPTGLITFFPGILGKSGSGKIGIVVKSELTGRIHVKIGSKINMYIASQLEHADCPPSTEPYIHPATAAPSVAAATPSVAAATPSVAAKSQSIKEGNYAKNKVDNRTETTQARVPKAAKASASTVPTASVAASAASASAVPTASAAPKESASAVPTASAVPKASASAVPKASVNPRPEPTAIPKASGVPSANPPPNEPTNKTEAQVVSYASSAAQAIVKGKNWVVANPGKSVGATVGALGVVAVAIGLRMWRDQAAERKITEYYIVQKRSEIELYNLANEITNEITEKCKEKIGSNIIGVFLDDLMEHSYQIINRMLYENSVYEPVVQRGRRGGGNNNAELEHIGEVSAKIAYAAWLTSSEGKNNNAVNKAALNEALELGVNSKDAKIYADIAAKSLSS